MVVDRLHPEVILLRTVEGQRTAFDEVGLDATRRRLLRLVNGYTSLGSLTSRLDREQDWRSAAESLLEQHLVEISPAD